ncbi:MAG: ECF-type sigma factor [Phycisphaerae bacterium]
MSRSAHDDPNAIYDAVYRQLRAVAQQRLAAERTDHTLQATALVHEVWLRLVGDRPGAWGGRAQFFAAAVEAMRRILIDHARRRGAKKRKSGAVLRGVLDLAVDENLSDALVLDDLILRLEREDAQAAAVVRLRFYTGLDVEQTAAVLGVSPSTVKRDWAFARTWLRAAWEDESA